MKKEWFLCAAVLIAACAHGYAPGFPPAADPANSAQVWVVRNDNLFDWGLSVGVRFDEVVIARLRAGEHVSARVAPGLHRIGLTNSGTPVALEKGGRYYFLVSADTSPAGFEIERLDVGRGEAWVAKTVPLR
jgi:hypothetical protein